MFIRLQALSLFILPDEIYFYKDIHIIAMITDILFILGVSIASSLFSEGVSWLFVYRTESYKKAKINIDRLTEQVEKAKESESSKSSLLSKSKGKDKKLERLEDSLKQANQQMTFSKMKSMFAVAISMISLFSYLNSLFNGVVVCKLPFEPIGFLQGLSHRNLAGTDMTDCSMTFLYVISSMTIRTNIQKILGTAPPKTSAANNPWASSFTENK
ncbi:hypothetical protein DFA_02024 [Cavenderia fasciculata]|uniref:Calcium load-activated calcium channel n=1 Tax=Cavenderia fasciculata TaxID=261658 RepID=F4PYH3_CACFS|nr:uncharacterized protein DFA_02024 [Cavenderia fasciculata]EGG19239.1 hypothetical protein DFA_02024 [Cavenderia fasciculata]|eukprot:XP_004357510.1 hypothetical protein DFA_02024 [Cavenderia fasciculata]